MDERITVQEKNMKFRFTVTFEKEIPVIVNGDDYDTSRIEEEVADKIFYNTEEYLDGYVVDTDDIQLID